MYIQKHRDEKQGFTLIELLIVIAIIGFLAAAVLVAVDPVKRIQDARDSRRFSEANAILNAILTKQVDDRRIFDGLAGEGIITSPTFSQVIVSDSSTIECDTDLTENFPGCNVTLDIGSTPSTSKACVANLGGLMTGTAVSSGTAVTGTGTDFNPEASVGDTLTSASGSTCTVATVTSDTAIVCSNTPSPVFAGAVYNTSKSIVPNFIATLPVDPRGVGTTICDTGCATNAVGITSLGTTNSGYYIHRTNGNRIEIGSCLGEQTTTINVKR
jgi:prepilin-type N-terminal cleavage/methylation domain-containing protein